MPDHRLNNINVQHIPQPNLQQTFRDAMASCAAAVYVVTTNGEAGRYGITMSAVTSVTDEPPIVMLCINKKASILPILTTNRTLCINVLATHQRDVAEHFAGLSKIAPHERFNQHIWHQSEDGQLLIEGALVYLNGYIIDQHQIGTHQLFFVQINKITTHKGNTAPALVYFRRQFLSLSDSD